MSNEKLVADLQYVMELENVAFRGGKCEEFDNDKELVHVWSFYSTEGFISFLTDERLIPADGSGSGSNDSTKKEQDASFAYVEVDAIDTKRLQELVSLKVMGDYASAEAAAETLTSLIGNIEKHGSPGEVIELQVTVANTLGLSNIASIIGRGSDRGL